MIMRTRTSAALVCLASVTFCACGNGAATTTATAPSSTPAANRAPTVTLTTDGPASCDPLAPKWRPYFDFGCQVIVKAVAIDPDGDPLSYSWSGTTAFTPYSSSVCSSGLPVDGPTVPCRISSPEQVVVASVIVRDGHDHTATASVNVIGEGVNHPPAVVLGKPFTFPGSSVTLEMFGSFADPDEPMCTNDHVVGGSATGDCRPNIAFWSSCLEGGPTVDIYRTRTTGTCDVTLKARDSANLVGTTVITIRY